MRSLGPPPPERPNWGRLNEGQRRYAWEQYQLARIRRGLLTDNARPLLDEPTDHFSQEAGPSNGGAASVRETTPPIDNRDDLLDDSGNDSVPPADGIVRSESSAVLPGRSTSGMAGVQNSQADSSSSGTKRPASGDAGTGSSKKSKTSLPGTGSEPGGDSIVRSGPIERPLFIEKGDIRVFRKVHRFFTYGLAYTILDVAETVGSQVTNHRYMLTPLCEVPWERPFMYMNPSEFSLLPSGARVLDMSCEIFQRNVRVAFKTNATTTDLATLNQNKNSIYAIGLLQSLDGVNVKPTGFEDTNPMKCNAIETENGRPKRDKSSFDDWVRKFYGVENDNESFSSTIPLHQIGMPFNGEYYYAMCTQKEDPLKSGWPCLQQHYKECDADSTSSKSILSISYQPEIGLLKPAIAPINTGNYVVASQVTQVNVARGVGNHMPRNQHQYIKDGYTTVYSEAGNKKWTLPASTQFTITELVEKCQQMVVGSNGSCVPKTQPSLHIGIQPVPALSSSAITQVNNAADKYTDTQCYWEVVCEMVVECRTPTYRPLASIANCKVSERMMQATDSLPNEKYSMFEGLYISTRAAVGAASVATTLPGPSAMQTD